MKAAPKDVNYKIRDSGLRRPHSTWILDKLSLSGGKFVSGGISIAIGVRDSPVHLEAGDYRAKMRWVDGQHVVLWDEQDKRGWLVNGPTALLHMVRASLDDDIAWSQRRAGVSDTLFKPDEMEPPPEPHAPSSALYVLLSEKNKNLEVFVKEVDVVKKVDGSDDNKKSTETTYKRFKHVVEDQYRLMEQIVAHQSLVRDGIDLKMRLRKYIMGWDFRDLAVTAKTDLVYIRRKSINTITRGWVDFTREHKAITIFGKGFGHLIRPANASSMCRAWARVPVEKYYLTACVSDLKALIKLEDDDENDYTTPIRIGKGLDWHAPGHLFRPCRCGKAAAGQGQDDVQHSDIAQVPVPPPKRFFKLPQTTGSIKLANAGAVIFGYSTVPWSKTSGEESSSDEDDEYDDIVDEMSDGEAGLLRDSGLGTSPAPTSAGGKGGGSSSASSSRAQARTGLYPDRTARAGKTSDDAIEAAERLSGAQDASSTRSAGLATLPADLGESPGDDGDRSSEAQPSSEVIAAAACTTPSRAQGLTVVGQPADAAAPAGDSRRDPVTPSANSNGNGQAQTSAAEPLEAAAAATSPRAQEPAIPTNTTGFPEGPRRVPDPSLVDDGSRSSSEAQSTASDPVSPSPRAREFTAQGETSSLSPSRPLARTGSAGRSVAGRTEDSVKGPRGRTDDHDGIADSAASESGHGATQHSVDAPRPPGEQSTAEGRAAGTSQGNDRRGGLTARLKSWFAKVTPARRSRR